MSERKKRTPKMKRIRPLADVVCLINQALQERDAARAEAERLRQECEALELLASSRRDELDASRDLAAKLVEGLAPFAWVGQWLFARNLPDDEPVVTITGIGKPVALTRGMFKAAHALSAKARALGIGSAPAPKGGVEDKRPDLIVSYVLHLTGVGNVWGCCHHCGVKLHDGNRTTIDRDEWQRAMDGCHQLAVQPAPKGEKGEG